MSRKNRGQRNTRKEKKESETVYSPTEKFVLFFYSHSTKSMPNTAVCI